MTDDGAYAAAARRALAGVAASLDSSVYSQCCGLSGIGETYLEAASALESDEWRLRGEELGRFLVGVGERRGSGLVWRETNRRPTADLMQGGGGICHFLLRLRGETASGPLLSTA